MKDRKIAVLYHADCNDGFLAACLVKARYRQTKMIPFNYGDPIPEEARNNYRLYIVDMTLKGDDLAEVCTLNKEVAMLDHHTDNFPPPEELDGYDNLRYWLPKENNSSGAMLVYRWFTHTGQFSPAIEVLPPWYRLVTWVDDYDRWTHMYPESKAVAAYLYSIPKSFDVWSEVIKEPFEMIIGKGEALLGSQKQRVRDLIKGGVKTRRREIRGSTKRVAYVNCPRDIASLCGHTILEEFPAIAVAVMYRINDGMIECSARSNDGGSAQGYAKIFGGGGHPDAAGFSVPVSKSFLSNI